MLKRREPTECRPTFHLVPHPVRDAVVSQRSTRDDRPYEGVKDIAFSVQMPALGESVTEGTVTRWLKREGDTVELDEPLLEVSSTDKVDTEIPSPAAGVLTRIVAQEDAPLRGDMSAFDSADRLAGTCGLAPVPRNSGRISGNLKRPRRYHRRLLRTCYLAAKAPPAPTGIPRLL